MAFNLGSMLTNLNKLGDEKGWVYKDGFAYGKVKNYLFSITDGQGFKIIFVPLMGVTETEKSHILKYISSLKNEVKLRRYGFDNSVLYVEIRERLSNAKIEQIKELVLKISNYLDEQRIVKNQDCIFCNQRDAKKIATLNKIQYYCHQECYDKALEELKEMNKNHRTSGKNYLSGIIGALVGGLVGALPWILSVVYFEKILALLSLVIGIGAFYGYSLFKGKVGPLTKWIVVFVGLITVFIADLIVIGILSAQVHYTFTEYLSKIAIEDFIVSLFIGILGLIPMYIQVKRIEREQLPPELE